MLVLSAAMRAVADETELWPAVEVLQREARSLLRSADATVVVYDRARRTTYTIEGAITAAVFRELVMRVAERGQRELFGNALIEPIGSAPARAVLALRRSPTDRFAPEDIVLASALVGGIAATLARLLGRVR